MRHQHYPELQLQSEGNDVTMAKINELRGIQRVPSPAFKSQTTMHKGYVHLKY